MKCKCDYPFDIHRIIVDEYILSPLREPMYAIKEQYYLCPKCSRRYTLDGREDGFMFHRQFDFRVKEAEEVKP